MWLWLCAGGAVLCCAALQVALYPQQVGPWLLSPDSLEVVVPVLMGEHLQGAAAPSQLQQLLLSAVAHSLLVRLRGPGACEMGVGALKLDVSSFRTT